MRSEKFVEALQIAAQARPLQPPPVEWISSRNRG
jgi:hypothetical protein